MSGHEQISETGNSNTETFPDLDDESRALLRYAQLKGGYQSMVEKILEGKEIDSSKASE